MADFTMPSLGADMESGKVVEWRVRSGDRIRPGDVIAVVETHKGAIDVECFLDGVIRDLAPAGVELPVGAVLARVDGAADTAAAASAPAAPGTLAVRQPARVASAASRARVSPAARRRAAELGIDAEALQGTGAEAAVTLADIEVAAAQYPHLTDALMSHAAKGGFDPALMRRAIAVAMARSKREIPHYYLTTTIDFGAAQAWLDAYNAGRDPSGRLLAATLLLKASARALLEVPQFNGFWEGDAFKPGAGIHPGWAISLRGGRSRCTSHSSRRSQVIARVDDAAARSRAAGPYGQTAQQRVDGPDSDDHQPR